jgi:hypothetical protein
MPPTPCPDCGWDGYDPIRHKPCGATDVDQIQEDLDDFEYPEDYGYAYGDEFPEDDCRG